MIIRSIQNTASNHNSSHWFPLSITWGKATVVCQELDKRGIEYILPSRDVMAGGIVPADTRGIDVKHLIFLHSSFHDITCLKHEAGQCRHMYFMTSIQDRISSKIIVSSTQTQRNNIVIVPDEEIATYNKAVTNYGDSLTLMLLSEKFKVIGKKIEITQGPLTGIHATVRRVNKNKHVFFDCGDLITLQMSYLPQTMYRPIEDNEQTRR